MMVMQDFDSLISFFVVSRAVKPGTPGIDRCVTVDNPEGILFMERYVKLRPDDYLVYTKLRDIVEEYRKAKAMPMVPVPGYSGNAEEIPAHVQPTVSSPSAETEDLPPHLMFTTARGDMATLFRQYVGLLNPNVGVLPDKKVETEILGVVDGIINGNVKYKLYRDYAIGNATELIGTCLYRLQESVCRRFRAALDDYVRKFSIKDDDGIEKFCRKFFKCSVSATFKKWLKAGIITDDVDKGITEYDLKWARSTVCKEPVGAQMFTLCELARISRIGNGKMLEPFVQFAPGTLTQTLLQSHYHALHGKMDLAIRIGIRQMMHGSFFRDDSRLTEDELTKKSDALYCKARQLFIKRLNEIPGEYLDMLEESAKVYDENGDSSYKKSLSVQPLAIVHSLVRHSLSEAARILKEDGFDMPE